MRPVVGFDLSLTCTGWAAWTGELAVGRIQPKGLAGARRRRWIAERVADHVDGVGRGGQEPLIVIEAVPTHGTRSIVQLGELHGVVLDHLDGYQPAYFDPSKLKKYATGNGNAAKEKVLEAARAALGCSGKSTDEADAVWLATVGRQLAGETGPLFTAQRLSLLAGVTWPEGLPEGLHVGAA